MGLAWQPRPGLRTCLAQVPGPWAWGTVIMGHHVHLGSSTGSSSTDHGKVLTTRITTSLLMVSCTCMVLRTSPCACMVPQCPCSRGRVPHLARLATGRAGTHLGALDQPTATARREWAKDQVGLPGCLAPWAQDRVCSRTRAQHSPPVPRLPAPPMQPSLPPPLQQARPQLSRHGSGSGPHGSGTHGSGGPHGGSGPPGSGGRSGSGGA